MEYDLLALGAFSQLERAAIPAEAVVVVALVIKGLLLRVPKEVCIAHVPLGVVELWQIIFAEDTFVVRIADELHVQGQFANLIALVPVGIRQQSFVLVRASARDECRRFLGLGKGLRDEVGVDLVELVLQVQHAL